MPPFLFSVFFRRLRTLSLYLVIGAGLALPHAAHGEDPWADAVVDYNAIDPNQGFDTPQKTVGEPLGGGTFAANNTGLHSVGRPGPAPGSYITLRFDTPVTDDPDNPMGLDCIVYGNATWVGGNPARKWIEAGLIAISADVNGNGIPDDPWYVIPGSRGYDRSILPEGVANPAPPLAGNVQNPNSDGTEFNWGYADLTPTQRKYLDNYVRPDDPSAVGLTPRSGGGDAFDIAWAVDEAGNPAGLSQFDFIRISAFISESDPALGYITPEIDAVADVAPDIDTDGDGILDEYETRVAGTDPMRPESTVLALEIPPEDGGSPAGTELGTAADAQGNAITLYSNGLRSGTRDFNCIVDILTVSDPAPAQGIGGLEKSGAVRAFQSSVADFGAAQVQDALFTIAYTSSAIAGLDEAGLQPWRFEDSGYTQAGITAVVKDMGENHVTFRSAYPGTFILASTPGSGDEDADAPDMVLHVTPAQGTAGDPGPTAAVSSDPIHLPDGSLVPDGTLFTVDTTLGTITSADAGAELPGVQIEAAGGVVSFTVQGGTTAGTASITARSLDGALSGAVAFLITAGEAVGPVSIYTLDNTATAPGPVDFTTGVLQDDFGNPLDAGAFVTLVVEGGTPSTPDADPAAPGHQLALTSGVANFSVRVLDAKDLESAMLYLALYADPAQTELLGEETFMFDVTPMPLGVTVPVMLVVLLIGAAGIRRRFHVKGV
ncbi:MAG: hypothetical protein ACLFTT_04295 [Candidatus Hydrogenedentota bacterium]